MGRVPRPSWVSTPSFDDGDSLRRDLYYAIFIVRSEFEEVPASETDSDVYERWEQRLDDPPDEFIVNSVAAINDGYCKIFAERVYELLGEPTDVEIESKGVTHTWLVYDGRYYDAECPEGVAHPSEPPVFNRDTL